jgi:DNA adenine methylase
MGILRYSPFRYPQGSHYLVKTLLSLIPPHHTYVEVFGGAASLLFAKEPSKIEVYNDINSELVNFFRVLRDDEKWQKLQEKLLLTPYSREEFNLALQPAEGLDDIERARRFFVRIQMSFGGKGETFSYGRSAACNRASTYFNRLAGFELFHQRIRRVIIENLDFEDIFKRYDTPETFFFCDPPYIGHKVRTQVLSFEMPLEDHQRLVNTVLRAKGKVLLLGYPHPVYEELERRGWQVKRIRVVVTITNSEQTGGKRRYRDRYVWMNYEPQPSSAQIRLTDFDEKPTTT